MDKESTDTRRENTNRLVRTKRVCVFCKNRIEPSYTDSAALRRFMTDRGKIVVRGRSGLCSRHQRYVAREIKRARNIALLPYTINI